MILVGSSLTVRESISGKSGIKPSTRASYLRLLNCVLDNELHDTSIMDWASTISNPNTKRSTLIALRSIGYEVGGVAPKVTKAYARHYDLPDEEDLRLMFSYNKYEVQYLTMMYLGLRLGEACHVSKQDLMPGGRIFIQKQVAEWIEDGKRVTEVREPKSVPAVIDCPPWLAERLPKTAPDLTPTNVRAALHYTSKRYLGKLVNPHSLRHWCATFMIRQGVPLPVVQRQMRHSDISTTLRIYAEFGGDRMSLFDNVG